MKTLKVAKYQISSSIGPIKIYYFIYLFVLLFFSVTIATSDGRASSSGLDFSTMIFLFVAGLNSFKSTFLLAQANNISRKAFFKGIIIAVFPITLTMTIIEFTINRVQNIFAKCANLYDMIYGNFRYFESSVNWTQSNDLKTIFATIIWQFAIFSSIFILGILISLCYYRSNKIMKVVISVVPVLLLGFSYNINNIFLKVFNINIANIISSAFGLQSQNPFIAILSLTILMIMFSSLIYLLIKRAVIKH